VGSATDIISDNTVEAIRPSGLVFAKCRKRAQKTNMDADVYYLYTEIQA
jgi:hypothetical protein